MFTPISRFKALLNIYKILAGIILLCDIEFQVFSESNDRVVYIVDERPLLYGNYYLNEYYLLN
jgi:hypothetical protein